MNAQTEPRTALPALATGGHVAPIIPASIEEIWRVSRMVVLGGLAPQALVAKKEGDEAISAVAIAVMAGAELGLPPMVALRSFTVISGKPALYGDGLINVVRRSKKATYIRTGYDPSRKVGWCEAKRADTGEEKREEFSAEQARRAGLWDDKPTRRGTVWKDGQKTWGEVPNDSPWHRYPERMLQWRAAGYCLRELFADVLGGITDEYEARELAGEMREINPEERTPPKPPSPPKPPAADQLSGELAALLAEVDGKMAKAEDHGDWNTIRTEYAHLQEQLSDDEWDSLDAVMHQHYERVRDAADRAELWRSLIMV